ncbi:MAG: hypothetical protein IPK74_19705 [Deltaproteobacteria bacterium]|nr:hypothetical protein [Deltaproteobacteria bacterium]
MAPRAAGWLFVAAIAALSPACQPDAEGGRPQSGLEGVTLSRVDPGLAVPGSVLVVAGDGFLDGSVSQAWLQLTGSFAGGQASLQLPATFVDFDELHVELTPDVLALLPSPTGSFVGNAQVVIDYLPTSERVASTPLAVELEFAATLAPHLADVQQGGAIYVNDAIPVEGEGFLLGGGEGHTMAVVEGCFQAMDAADCTQVGPIEIPVEPTDPLDRTRGSFPFSPRIVGLSSGTFSGLVYLRNAHQSGEVIDGDADAEVEYELIPTEITAAGTSSGSGASLGQYIDIDGGGFVGGEEGLTTVVLSGTFTPDGAPEGAPVELELVPEFVDGRRVRYVINEDDGLGTAIDVRVDAGSFDGTIAPRVAFESEEVLGVPTPFAFAILPVRQVVWVRFLPSYVESLRLFGLRALDSMIRERILAVLRRDYESINIEFREEEPTDFALFATLDIAGPDPNGLGLLGYDNTNGKDTNNERLFDHIGGVNALTQEDGFPGFGGVFIESLFAFSTHPAVGKKQDVADPLFDRVFDPFRPDTGTPFSSADLSMGAVPVLANGGGCPTDERLYQAACAVWVMGSMIGTTVSHENGHSLGLADPLGTRFHNLGDAPNRLMDAGGARTLRERAELEGEGPAVFCVDEYEYLREILPTSDPETSIERPYC